MSLCALDHVMIDCSCAWPMILVRKPPPPPPPPPPSTVGVIIIIVLFGGNYPWCIVLRVFFLSIPEDSVKERLTLRRVDPTTGER